MGSFGTFGPYTLEGIVQEFTHEWQPDDHTYKVIEPRVTKFGHNLWGIQTVDGEPVCIMLWLVSYYTNEWVYKPMDETSGPNECDCPLDLLEKCPVPEYSQWAKDWRERVKAYHETRHERRTRKLSPGDTIMLVNGESMIVESVGKRGAIIARAGYMRYRVPRGMLA